MYNGDAQCTLKKLSGPNGQREFYMQKFSYPDLKITLSHIYTWGERQENKSYNSLL